MICDAWDVVVVPFPFTDSPAAKRRPALAISRRRFNASGRVVACMITTSRSAQWPGDFELDEGVAARLGLPRSSIIRSMKLFTIDNRLIVRKIGSLGDRLFIRKTGSQDEPLRTVVASRIGELLLGC